MRRLAAPVFIAAFLLVVSLFAASGASGGRTASSATLLIRHQHSHCHAWSLNGGPFRAAQTLHLQVGGTVTVINNDVMPHRLIASSGPHVAMHNGTTMPMGGAMHGAAAPGVMNHVGASTQVKLSKRGTYHFRTHAGEDYMQGIETTGEDNTLTLTVIVG